MSIHAWTFFAIVLIAQNFSFTFVSRARNSGSLRRHLFAALLSNSIWFVGQAMVFTQLFKIMTGTYGLSMAAFSGAFYTLFTLVGALGAHYYALKTERGIAAVGANRRRAEITPEEWARVKAALGIE